MISCGKILNAYTKLERKIDKYPKLATIGNTTLSKTVTENFANGLKQYSVSGEGTFIPKCKLQFKLVEEFFNKCKNGKYFEELPFFKKITETKPEYADRALVITRANGNGLSSVTTVNSEGIRLNRVTKRLNKDGTHYDCARYGYNDNGTKPTVIATWTESP